MALLLFFIASSFWAILSFGASLLDAHAVVACQGMIAFSSAFDQIARFSLEQYVLWSLARDFKASGFTFVSQTFIFLRLIVGGTYVGFQRPQFHPVCIPQSVLLPLAIALLAMDAVIAFFLFIFALLLNWRNAAPDTGASHLRKRFLPFVPAALGIWTGVSE